MFRHNFPQKRLFTHFFLTFIAQLVSIHTFAQEPANPPQNPSINETAIDHKALGHRELMFNTLDNELKLGNPRLNYDLKASGGSELKMGSVVFNNESFQAEIKERSLSVKWDKNLIKGGDLTLFDPQGKPVWAEKTEEPGTFVSKNFSDKVLPLAGAADKLRFCITSGRTGEFAILCSQWYALQKDNNDVVLAPAKTTAIPKVIVNKKETSSSGRQEVALGQKVHFFALLRSEATYEFESEPVKPVMRDLIQEDNKETVLLTGEIPEPLGQESKVYPERQESAFIKAIGFEDTILPNPTLWQTEVKINQQSLSFPGKFGGIFEFPIEIKNPPGKKLRMYVADSSSDGTYLAKDQWVVFNEKGESKPWEVTAPESFKINRNFLEVPGEKTTHKAYLDVYRGSSGEISGRFTGMLTESGFIAFGEAHAAWWFNDLFGWQNATLSKQRWGVSARQFTALTDVSAKLGDGSKVNSTLSVLNVDLRYRLTPGLWERTETVGLILGYESGQYGKYPASKTGAGVFWARSMPKVFDDWMNVFSFMRYPKWVDMELVNYFASPDSDVTLNSDFAINFHGKVLWTQNFFGEAGFGYKSYSFQTGPEKKTFELQTLYGTLGLGMNF